MNQTIQDNTKIKFLYLITARRTPNVYVSGALHKLIFKAKHFKVL